MFNLSTMKNPKHSNWRFQRLLCFVLALYFLNFSVDSSDANPDTIPEDLTVNDIESLAELVTEVVLDCTNAFAEHDERDSDDGGMLDFSKEFFCTNSSISIKPPCTFNISPQYSVRNSQPVLYISRDVNIPPPKV